MTGFLFEPQFLLHDTGPGHPECAMRLANTIEFLERRPWFSQLKPIHAKPVDLKWVETIHSPDYIARVKRACDEGYGFLDSPDVAICTGSYEIARLATGGALALGDALMSGEIQRGFGLMRPPGHHAERDHAMGFCLFNNIAILARYLQKQHGLERVAIVDWDVHHGNGTQHSFETDPSVFYVSLHQFPHYPGTGQAAEKGIGDGHGTTLNLPVPAGTGDATYKQLFQESVIPILEDYAPQAVLISAGFDAHRDDPLGQIDLSTDCFRWMSEQLLALADRCAEGRLLSLLEGGYNLQVLPHCVAEHVDVLLHWNPTAKGE